MVWTGLGKLPVAEIGIGSGSGLVPHVWHVIFSIENLLSHLTKTLELSGFGISMVLFLRQQFFDDSVGFSKLFLRYQPSWRFKNETGK